MDHQRIENRLIRAEPYLHVGIWLVVLVYPYLKYSQQEGGYPMPFLHELNALFFKMTISYFLYRWFFPRKKHLGQFVLLIVAFATNIILYEYFDDFFHPSLSWSWKSTFADLLTYTGFGIVFYALFTVKKLYKQQIEIDTLTREKEQAELRALKARINPHFLFNTLNTLYAHALRKDEKTPHLILKLSDNFRYVLQEGRQDLVPIKAELRHLRDYVELQQERLSNKVDIEWTETVDNEEQKIAPLILVGFIENAFKYTSILKGDHHRIKISITLEKGVFQFLCINPYSENSQEGPEWQGNGTSNRETKKRLQLLYPDKSQLDIRKQNYQHQVTLELQLP